MPIFGDLRPMFPVWRAYGRREFEGALAMCERMLADDPENTHAESILVMCLYALGRLQDMIAAAERALASRPDDFQLLRYAIHGHYQLGNHARARVLVLRALAVYPPELMPALVRRILHLVFSLPVLRRLADPEEVANIAPGEEEERLAAWKRWAEHYVRSPPRPGGA